MGKNDGGLQRKVVDGNGEMLEVNNRIRMETNSGIKGGTLGIQKDYPFPGDNYWLYHSNSAFLIRDFTKVYKVK